MAKMAKKILVVGGGGREHALAWKIANDSEATEIYCAPGNAGTAALGQNLDIAAEDVGALVAWARTERPDLTVIGPEAPLCAGLADHLIAEGLRVFGPSKAAAQLEGSKTFAKEIMAEGGVPTAKYACFTDCEAACEYIRAEGAPLVVKADGLAAGKGVAVCATTEEAEQFARDVLAAGKFGAAGASLLVEECLQGEEASILALIDGEHIVMLASSQDHKRAYEGDAGPNTGGMGAYSPAPVITEQTWPQIRSEVYERTLAALARRGIEFKGVLYAGLMITSEGPKVLEFNCRFGDPEVQAIVARWQGDILPALEACIDGDLDESMVAWRDEAAVCVVMASGGYPGSYSKGCAISGLAAAGALEGVSVFHAGTTLSAEKVVTSGGRVLGVTAIGADLAEAVERAYQAVDKIAFENSFYRRDIAHRAL
jgi:phosphoribosylamine---glycine ligase